MATPNPYHQLARHAVVLEMLTENGGELTEELARDLGQTEETLEGTAEQLLELRDVLDGLELAAEAVIAREKAKLANYAVSKGVLEQRLEAIVRRVGPLVLQAGSRHVALKQSLSQSVPRPDLLPDDYKRLIPPTPPELVPDGRKILSDLKKGVFIPGAQLVATETLDVK